MGLRNTASARRARQSADGSRLSRKKSCALNDSFYARLVVFRLHHLNFLLSPGSKSHLGFLVSGFSSSFLYLQTLLSY